MSSLGYHDCPCRDCFEIAIGGTGKRPALCSECSKHGCRADGDEECNAPHAYNAHCGDVSCCGASHPAIGDIPEHAPSEQFYSACPACKES